MDSIALSSIHGDDSDTPVNCSKFANIMNYVSINFNKNNSYLVLSIDQRNSLELQTESIAQILSDGGAICLSDKNG